MSNNYKRYFLTSESVTEGHADKVCDYISDSILDACLEQDRESRVAVETFISKDKVVVAGQITSNAIINIEKIVYTLPSPPVILYKLRIIDIQYVCVLNGKEIFVV